MNKQWELSGNAENIDCTDIAVAGRAYADNLIGEPNVSKLMHAMADEIVQLREAIRRFAEQDATLSVSGGHVTVTMDGPLTAEEREAISWAAEIACADDSDDFALWNAGIMQRLLKRTK